MNTSFGPYPQDVFWMRERVIGNREEFTEDSRGTILVGPKPNLLRCTPVPWTAETSICGWPDWAVDVWLHTLEYPSSDPRPAPLALEPLQPSSAIFLIVQKYPISSIADSAEQTVLATAQNALETWIVYGITVFAVLYALYNAQKSAGRATEYSKMKKVNELFVKLRGKMNAEDLKKVSKERLELKNTTEIQRRRETALGRIWNSAGRDWEKRCDYLIEALEAKWVQVEELEDIEVGDA
ncbi:hypothetical protein C8R44DRAFT_424605 [Mycena epipterygia]|nr:hypothetical protein C8R44DRAFT_424605 [Mycena epipterygia]